MTVLVLYVCLSPGNITGVSENHIQVDGRYLFAYCGLNALCVSGNLKLRFWVLRLPTRHSLSKEACCCVITRSFPVLDCTFSVFPGPLGSHWNCVHLFVCLPHLGSDFPASFQTHIKKIFKYLFQVCICTNVYCLVCPGYTIHLYYYACKLSCQMLPRACGHMVKHDSARQYSPAMYAHTFEIAIESGRRSHSNGWLSPSKFNIS